MIYKLNFAITSINIFIIKYFNNIYTNFFDDIFKQCPKYFKNLLIKCFIHLLE